MIIPTSSINEPAPVKLILAIGTPGVSHGEKRSNAGFLTIDSIYSKVANTHPLNHSLEWKFAKKYMASAVIKEPMVLLVKPRTPLIHIGRLVNFLIAFFHLESDDLFLLHHDLRIDLGAFEIVKNSQKPSSAGFVSTIQEQTKVEDFWRIGVGIADSDYTEDPTDYLDQNFEDKQKAMIRRTGENLWPELLTTLDPPTTPGV